MKMLSDIKRELLTLASNRERLARELFVQARQGVNIDGKLLLLLDNEAKKLRKAAEVLV